MESSAKPPSPESDDAPTSWTIVLVPQPDSVPAAQRVRRLLKWAHQLRLRAVLVRDATPDEMLQVQEWEI